MAIEITDPNILSQLNAPITTESNNSTGSQEITDPAILSQLNAPISQPVNNSQQSSGIFNWLGNLGKSGILGGSELGQLVLNKLGNPSYGGIGLMSLPYNAVAGNAQTQANLISRANQLGNFNQNFQNTIPNTFANRLAENLVREFPAIALSIASGGTTLPEVLASMGAQGAAGYGLNPNNPTSGAVTGAVTPLFGMGLNAVGHGLAARWPNIFNKISPTYIRNSMSKLQPYAQSLFNEAEKGYNVLENMGDKNLVDPLIPTASDVFGNMDPQFANPVADFIKSQTGKSGANSDILDELRDELSPSYSSVIQSKFDPETLNTFNSLPRGKAGTAYQNFLNSPTAQNAGIFKRALGAARGPNVDQNQIYNDMRNQLNDNIIMPAIEKAGTPEEKLLYGNADANYRQYMQMFGDDPEMESFAKGNISPEDMSVNRYYSMLQRRKEAGGFNALSGEPQTLPMQQYNKLQAKIINPGWKTNALTSGLYGLQGIYNQ